MSECLLCQESFQEKLSLKELFTWKSWEPIIICPTCQEAFHYLKGPRCQQCSREWEEEDYCSDCLTWQREDGWYFRNYSLCAYNAVFKDWLHTLKSKGDVRVAGLFTQELKKIRGDYPGYTWLAIPGSSAKFKNRGFHQSELILDQAGIPYQRLIHLSGSKKKQAQLNRQERLANQRQIERLTEGPLPQKILLFDDVYTTGATIHQVARFLEAFGVEEITSLTLGR